jgi:membrane-associated phospholipid phosphatase
MMMFEQFDNSIFHFINGFAGQPFLDSLVNFEEQFFLLKGGLFMGVYCWLWFEYRGQRGDDQRRTIIAMVLASFTALVIARCFSHILPFRVRPMYADVHFHAPSFPIAPNFVDWSSFPSDHAAMFFSLALGVYLLWRPLGILLLLYTAIWICLPRLYLGLHYPTDLVGGAILGSASVFSLGHLSKTKAFYQWVARPLLNAERKYPSVFYALSFWLLFEMGVMFGDVRYAARHASFLFQLSPKNEAILVGIFAMILYIAVLFWRRATSDGSSRRNQEVRQSGFTAKLSGQDLQRGRSY